jgi:hypothetical protein
MRYVIAISVAVFLVLCMFAYAHWMAGCELQWSQEDVELSTISVLGIHLAHFIKGYWYSVVPLLFIISLGIAMILARVKSSRLEELSKEDGAMLDPREAQESQPPIRGEYVRRRGKVPRAEDRGAVSRERIATERPILRRKR